MLRPMTKWEENERTPSTTWEWRKVRVRARTPAPGSAARAKRAPLRLSPRSWREPLTCVIRYRGGREAWVEIRARGTTLRVPGHLAVVDVVARLNGMSQEGWDATENGR